MRLNDLKSIDATLVFYEAPSRVSATLVDMAEVFGNRSATVARELTKRYEEVVRGPLSGLAEAFADTPGRGEYVLVVGPPEAGEVNDAAIGAALADALQDMRLKDAAKAVSDALGVSRNRVYDIGLKLKGRQGT